MATGNENLLGALIQALIYCWDESIGYRIGGNFNPNTDCSGFIWQCLHENGFDVGASRFDTTTQAQILVNAGFTMLRWGVDTNTPQHGDIFMYDEGGGANGHTFFYAENVRGYVNGYQGWEYCDGTIGVCQQVKIEASGTHDHPEDGDQDNGHGAHTEVWVHSYAGSDPTYGSHTWYVFRWAATPPGPIPPGPIPGRIPYWLMKKIHDNNFK